MILSDIIKQQIVKEYTTFKESMYAGKSLEERQQLDQFFTPPELTIPMIELFECDSLAGKTVLDPTSGSGNLLAACLIAGADADKVFGNDYDAAMVKICRERIKSICNQLDKKGFNDYQIHRGNAMQKRCTTDFSSTYQQHYRQEYIDDLNYATGKYSWEIDNKLAAERNKKIETEELW